MTLGKRLLQYCEDDEHDFFFNLRSTLTWDVAMFEKLDAAMLELLNELHGAETVPRWVVGFFCWQTEAIIGLSTRSDIAVANNETTTSDQDVIQQGVAKLRRYQLWFSEDRDPQT